jgi:hypothetical protein
MGLKENWAGDLKAKLQQPVQEPRVEAQRPHRFRWAVGVIWKVVHLAARLVGLKAGQTEDPKEGPTVQFLLRLAIHRPHPLPRERVGQKVDQKAGQKVAQTAVHLEGRKLGRKAWLVHQKVGHQQWRPDLLPRKDSQEQVVQGIFQRPGTLLLNRV